jgi:Holliday junction DNA helicase RuvA
MPAQAFRAAVAAGDIKALSQISGVGRKTAERIVVELKDKVGQVAPLEPNSPPRSNLPAEQAVQDAVLALVALGYKASEAQDTIRAAQAVLGTQASVEQLVRASLRKGGG